MTLNNIPFSRVKPRGIVLNLGSIMCQSLIAEVPRSKSSRKAGQKRCEISLKAAYEETTVIKPVTKFTIKTSRAGSIGNIETCLSTSLISVNYS